MDDMSPETRFPASLFYVMLFDILQGLLFSLLLLVLTAQTSSTVKRTKTWFMFIGSIVEWCAVVSCSLLVIKSAIDHPLAFVRSKQP